MYYVYTFSLYTCILNFSIKLHELPTTYRNFNILNKERLCSQIQSFARSNADCRFFFFNLLLSHCYKLNCLRNIVLLRSRQMHKTCMMVSRECFLPGTCTNILFFVVLQRSMFALFSVLNFSVEQLIQILTLFVMTIFRFNVKGDRVVQNKYKQFKSKKNRKQFLLYVNRFRDDQPLIEMVQMFKAQSEKIVFIIV